MSENAAERKNFVSEIYNRGVIESKKAVLSGLPEKYMTLHNEGYIHIHDLEAYGKVYNCSMPDYKKYILSLDNPCVSTAGKIGFIFSNLKMLISKIAVAQTGGIGFDDFDCNMSDILDIYGLEYCNENTKIIYDHILIFLKWINENRERYCREPYYLTFNIGLSTTLWGRFVSKTFIEIFYNLSSTYTRPNIVYKVSKSINSTVKSVNYDIYIEALKCSAKKMIPTYLLLDSETNKDLDKNKLGIMGCRTRVYQNVNGEVGCLGRGNIANISVNLPRIALESKSTDEFFEKLHDLLDATHKILLHRVELMKFEANHYLSIIFDNKLWRETIDFNSMMKQGTLSVGFIGLNETVYILTEEKPHKSPESYEFALNIIKYMRNYLDKCSEKENMNYSLLASPGELISGRFFEKDSDLLGNELKERGFYTNSFHMEVDSRASVFQKIDYEAPFHRLCNGGSITYVEFSAAPIHNSLAIKDIIEYATNQGISYLGINYPMDICNQCQNVGTFDVCPVCGSNDIKRLRRVSGYLEDLSYFTEGKKREVKYRKSNI